MRQHYIYNFGRGKQDAIFEVLLTYLNTVLIKFNVNVSNRVPILVYYPYFCTVEIVLCSKGHIKENIKKYTTNK